MSEVLLNPFRGCVLENAFGEFGTHPVYLSRNVLNPSFVLLGAPYVCRVGELRG